MLSLPSGTVTFLLSDIEGSTRLWTENPEGMKDLVARHDALLITGIEAHGGVVVKSRCEGDSIFAVFSRATDAAAAALALQRAILVEPWLTRGPLRVRMALHTGEAELRDGDYFGAAVNRCARLRAIAHGGQVLLSRATMEVIRDALPHEAGLLELGVHRLQDLAHPEHVFQLQHEDLLCGFPPLRSLEAYPNNLPRQLTSFIGREREMAEVRRLFRSALLLTLTGPGGTGKTRLALQLAADLLEEYPDGVWLVELGHVSDPALISQAVVTALGLRPEPYRPVLDTLCAYLQARRILLVLDNCEHLVGACAKLAETLLLACTSLRILATSREALGISGETTWRVPSLSLPEPDEELSLETLPHFEAVRLFVERAATVRPEFSVTGDNAAAVAQLCRRLDGIPLALELAAARTRMLTPEQIARRLDDRFRLLTGGRRTALPRQQTLRAAIDWSYDLLGESERAVLRRLAVFHGGWTLDAAETVAADPEPGAEEPPPVVVFREEVLELLSRLVDKSLVIVEESPGGEIRYRLLETVRQYGLDRLLETGDAAAARDRHLAYFLRFAEEQQVSPLAGPRLVPRLDRLAGECDNLCAALDWSLDATDGLESSLRLVEALSWFWTMRCLFREGRRFLNALLRRSEDMPPDRRAEALRAAGLLAQMQGEYREARPLLEASLALRRQGGDRRALGEVLGTLAFVVQHQGDYEHACRLYEESLSLLEGLEIPYGASWTRMHLGFARHLQGDFDGARPLMEESLRELHHQGLVPGTAWALYHLGWLAQHAGELERARILLEECLRQFQEIGETLGTAWCLSHLGWVGYLQGDPEGARRLLRESLSALRTLGDKEGIAWTLARAASLAAECGRAEAAAHLLGAVEALREAIGSPLPPPEQPVREGLLASLAAALAPESLEAALAAGRTMALDRAILRAREELG